jgi:SAM-dependent methyltransferase
MDLKLTLDQAAHRIESGDGTEVVDELCGTLGQLMRDSTPAQWLQDVVAPCRSHRLHALLLQDPYTARAWRKPRGYAGDAEMLDYVYGGTAPAGTTAEGLAVFRGTTGGPNGRSVVHRRDWLAARIDEIAAGRSGTRVLSIACGHLREGARSRAVAEGRVTDFVGVDQDALSLAVAERDNRFQGVRFVNARVMDLVRGERAFEGFGFVYAAGLFDYLPADLARRLLVTMLHALRPGGWLLVGNFTPDNHGRGYMECFMDWQLLCRDEAALEDLRVSVPAHEVAAHRLYRDPGRNVVYLELQRT